MGGAVRRLRVIGEESIQLPHRGGPASPRVGNTARTCSFQRFAVRDRRQRHRRRDLRRIAVGSRRAPDPLVGKQVPLRLVRSSADCSGPMGGITYGIPALAKQVAAALPPSIETRWAATRSRPRSIGYCSHPPRCRPRARKGCAHCSRTCFRYRGRGGLPARAAIEQATRGQCPRAPFGEVVVTDQLVELAKTMMSSSRSSPTRSGICVNATACGGCCRIRRRSC